MLRRDYIMRLLMEFMAALERMLERKDIGDRREEIKRLYDKYVGPYTLYHNATIDEVMTAIAGMEEQQRLPRIEMLAELYYAEAGTVGNPTRDMLLGKAYALFEYIERNGDTFSMERRGKMKAIQKTLDNITGNALQGQ